MLLNKSLLKKILIVSFLALSISSCIQFKTLSLYDGDEVSPPPVKPKSIGLLVEPTIYYDDPKDVWGLEKNACLEAGISTDVVYSGKEAIKLEWNRENEGCKWAGIGIGWDSYAGKDLSEIINFVAIQMFVRTIKGRSFGLPMVLTFEDYSGGMGFAYTSNKYFERTAIDEKWQKVLVPLTAFDIEEEELNFANIKQLQIELQQSGSFYLDDISLVFYEEVPQKPWLKEEVLPNPTALPIQIFGDNFINNNHWGLIADDCQMIELSNTETANGKTSIHAKWDDQKGCKLMAFGASWNKWHPVDITAIRDKAAIQFKLKNVSTPSNTLPIKIGFEDYERAKRFVSLQSQFVEGAKYTTAWKTVTVPLSAIPDNGFDLTRTKQLYIELEGSGEVYMDEIRLVKTMNRP